MAKGRVPTRDELLAFIKDSATPVGKREIARAFHDAFVILDRRIGLFLSLPLGTLENLAIKREIDNIGQS